MELIANERLVAEFEAVTQRPWFRERVSAQVSERLVADLSARATLVAEPVDVPAVCRDPHDDYLVALARTSHADALVSGDDDLVSLELPDVAILTPRELIDRLD